MNFKTAMILAAGRGERLRPLTDKCPKALCLVGGKPLLEYHLRNLDAAGIEHVIINHAYLGGQIRAYVANSHRKNPFTFTIDFSPEPPGGLETGGGIVNALPLLGSSPFITINADIYTDYPLTSLALPTDSLAHLVLVHNQNQDFGLANNKYLSNQNRQYTFSGIAAYHPIFFNTAPYGRYSITPQLRRCVALQQATGELYAGAWFDIGSIEKLRECNAKF